MVDQYQDGDIAENPQTGEAFRYNAAQNSWLPFTQTTQQKVEPQSGFLTGLMDPIHGAAQLLANITPAPLEQKINQLNNYIADNYGLLSKIPEGGVNEMVAQREAQYQAGRKAEGDTGVDWDRIGGSILSPANLALASRIPIAAATTAGRVGLGAISGGIFGAAAPVTGGDYWTEKAKQIGTGAAAGAATSGLAAGLSRIIKPQTSEEVKKLMAEGVTPTPGEVLGGAAKRTEDALTSLPVVGDAIKAAQTRSIEDFNRAAINRSLEPIGKALPKTIPVGRKAIEYADDAISQAYDDLLPKLVGKIDDQFKVDLDSLTQAVQWMPPEQKAQFSSIVKNEIIDRFTPAGLASGETVKQVESKLGKIVRGYLRNEDYDKQALGDAVREAQAILRRMMERNNPAYQGELSKINGAWANFMRVQNAAARTGAKEGVFTAAQLKSSVRQLDPTRNKTSFSKGGALMQDLAEAGDKVLAQKVPDSGTPLRMLTNVGALGGAYALSPWTLAGAGAGMLAYTQPAQKLAATLLTQRPDIAGPLALGVKNAGPLLGPVAAPTGYSLFQYLQNQQ